MAPSADEREDRELGVDDGIEYDGCCESQRVAANISADAMTRRSDDV
jgi:hypothetical protein